MLDTQNITTCMRHQLVFWMVDLLSKLQDACCPHLSQQHVGECNSKACFAQYVAWGTERMHQVAARSTAIGESAFSDQGVGRPGWTGNRTELKRLLRYIAGQHAFWQAVAGCARRAPSNRESCGRSCSVPQGMLPGPEAREGLQPGLAALQVCVKNHVSAISPSWCCACSTQSVPAPTCLTFAPCPHVPAPHPANKASSQHHLVNFSSCQMGQLVGTVKLTRLLRYGAVQHATPQAGDHESTASGIRCQKFLCVERQLCSQHEDFDLTCSTSFAACPRILCTSGAGGSAALASSRWCGK